MVNALSSLCMPEIGFGFEIWSLGFGVWGLGFGFWGLGFEVWDGVLVLGLEVSGLGFKI